MGFLSKENTYQSGDLVGDRYRIIKPLGQGSSGITYRAEDRKRQQHVALKVLSLQRMDDWKRFELFEREARVLAQLDHPGIPRYLDYFKIETETGGIFCLVQELADGASLADIVERGWRSNEEKAKHLAAQILEILIYLHELTPPVVHRDIKPQNIIGHKNGQISLVDFGAVQDVYRDTMLAGSTVVGTFGYMAPEQFRGRAVPATDLYGLGATLLFLVTRQSPAELPEKNLKVDVRACVKLSEPFTRWLEGMLEPDCDRRFKSATEALTALQNHRYMVAPSDGNSTGFTSTVRTMKIGRQELPQLLVHIPSSLPRQNLIAYWGKYAILGLMMIFIVFLFFHNARIAAVSGNPNALIIAVLFLVYPGYLVLSALRNFRKQAHVREDTSIDVNKNRLLISKTGLFNKNQIVKSLPLKKVQSVRTDRDRGVAIMSDRETFYLGSHLSAVDRAKVTDLIDRFIEES